MCKLYKPVVTLGVWAFYCILQFKWFCFTKLSLDSLVGIILFVLTAIIWTLAVKFTIFLIGHISILEEISQQCFIYIKCKKQTIYYLFTICTLKTLIHTLFSAIRKNPNILTKKHGIAINYSIITCFAHLAKNTFKLYEEYLSSLLVRLTSFNALPSKNPPLRMNDIQSNFLVYSGWIPVASRQSKG